MSFPSIEQFRHVIQTVRYHAWYVGKDDLGNAIYDESRPVPTLHARGTVKLHGTNAGVSLQDGVLKVFSRKQEVRVGADNAGFAFHVSKHEEAFKSLFDRFDDEVMIRGEWCGPGIMKGTAINQLDEKLFVIFAISRGEGDDREWLDITKFADLSVPEARIFSIASFGTWEIEIDFADPAKAGVELERITNAVEAECPVGKFFGVSGIGEGIVWVIDEPAFLSSKFWFKVKGEKHKVSGTKKVVEIDPEVAASIEEFVSTTVSEQRLQQGLEVLKTDGVNLDQAATGSYIQWVVKDVLKEEADRLEVSGLTKKDVGGALSKAARTFWFQHLNERAGL